MTAPTRRPGTVTLLVVLVVIAGFLEVLAGLAVLFLGDDVTIDGANKAGFWLGVSVIIFGLIYLAVAKGLSNSNGFSRFLVALVSVLGIIGGVWSALTQSGNARWSGIGSVIFGMAVLAILYSRRSNEFFAGR